MIFFVKVCLCVYTHVWPVSHMFCILLALGLQRPYFAEHSSERKAKVTTTDLDKKSHCSNVTLICPSVPHSPPCHTLPSPIITFLTTAISKASIITVTTALCVLPLSPHNHSRGPVSVSLVCVSACTLTHGLMRTVCTVCLFYTYGTPALSHHNRLEHLDNMTSQAG